MSPTYATSFAIQDAAKAHGWEFIKWTPEIKAWGMRKDNLRIMLREDRRGGLRWVSLHRRFEGGHDCVRLGQDHRNKREAVLSWLTEPIDWTQWGFRNRPAQTP